MKKNMKAVVISSIAVLLIFSSFVFADTQTSSNIQVSLLRYTPFPAEPGSYVTLTFKIENKASGDANDVRIRLSPEYPFSIDNNSVVRVQNSADTIPIGNNQIVSLGKIPVSQYTVIEYNVRVASDTLEGYKNIKLEYQSQGSSSWEIKTFSILVQGTDRLEVSNVYPAVLVPGKPTDVLFTLNNSGTASINNIVFTWNEKDNKILPLGSGNTKYISSVGPKESVQIPFTLVSDPSVTSGAYNLNTNISYVIGSNISKSISLNVGIFIGGSGVFDVTLQDSASGAISFSVANVGSTPATSVSVRVPEQEEFSVTGPSSSFVGNLNPGDFTIVSFQVISKNQFSGRQNSTSTNPLKLEISYTDTNSNRQTIERDVFISSFQSSTQVRASGGSRSTSAGSGLFLIIIGVVGVVAVILIIKYNSKFKNFLKRDKK